MGQPTINRPALMQAKNIPAIAIVGMFFFCSFASADSLQFSVDLFEKGEWALCRRECKRALLSKTDPAERFQLLEALSDIRAGISALDGITKLKPIVAANKDPQVSSIASYELGRLYWQLEQPEEAFGSLALSFQTTTNKSLFLRSSCSLSLLFKEYPELTKGREDLVAQIDTSRGQWYGALFTECAKPDPEKNQPQPPNWVIRFYRSQISPAIGNRCNLEPSCSEYFHQANCQHGSKSIPMIADRLVREPGVNQRKEKPVVMDNGQIRYRDPIEDHDFWMKK